MTNKSTNNSNKSLKETREYVRSRFMSFGHMYYDMVTDKRDCTAGTIMSILNEMNYDPQHIWHIHEELRTKSRSQNGRMHLERILIEYSGLSTYEPNEEAIVIRDGVGYLNAWRPLGYKPTKGDVKPFLEHLKLVLRDDVKVEFLLDFIAFRMQKPREKATQALYLFGKQGSGKGTLKNILQDVFGASAVKYAGDSGAVKAIENWGRTFFIVDEIEVKKSSADYDRIKALIVEKSMEGRLLYQNHATHQTTSQLIMFSNHSPSFLERDDRRFFVAEWSIPFDIDSEEHAKHFDELHQWIAKGIPALGYFLLNRDLSKYKPYSAPPMTVEKKKATALAIDSQVEKVLDYLDEHPEQVLFTLDEIKSALGDQYLKESALKHTLTAAGMTKEADAIMHERKRYRFWVREGWAVDRKTKPITVFNLSNKSRHPWREVSYICLGFEDTL